MQELFDDTMTGETPLERNDLAIERWIARARIGAIAYASLCGLAGVIFILVEVSSGQFAGAVVAFFVTLATCGLGLASLAGVRMARTVHANTKRLDKLNYRIDQLEAAFDAHEMDVQLISGEPRDPSMLVSASLPADQYPRLAPGEAESTDAPTQNEINPEPIVEKTSVKENTDSPAVEPVESKVDIEQPIQKCRRLWGELKGALEDKQIESWRKRLDQLNRDHARDLRCRFAQHLRDKDYVQALEVGRQIVDLYPDSRMAADFRALESRIERLAFGNQPPRIETGS